MNKYLRKSLYVGLSALMISGLGAFISSNIHASINPDRYGIDVFPSKKTHNRFAYQVRRHGHNSRVYYATKDSKLGRAIFDQGNSNIDYANYMDRYHHSWYYFITKRLEGHVARHRDKAKKQSHKIIHKHRSVIRIKHNKRVKRYNHKIRVIHKRVAKKQRRRSSFKVLKSHFKRSNNRRLLKQSGFKDAQNDPNQLQYATFIFNKYAPNDKRAVVPKNFKGTNWLKGKVGQLNPTAYYYKHALHGWVQLK